MTKASQTFDKISHTGEKGTYISVILVCTLLSYIHSWMKAHKNHSVSSAGYDAYENVDMDWN